MSPTVLRKNGYRFYFYSNESHEPAHIHIVGKGGEMKIWIPSMTIAHVFHLSPTEQRNVMKLVNDNMDLFMEKWNEFSNQKR